MSEKTTKQSFLNFIFKETVSSGSFWPKGWEGRRHAAVRPAAAVTRRLGGRGGRGGRCLQEVDAGNRVTRKTSVVFYSDGAHSRPILRPANTAQQPVVTRGGESPLPRGCCVGSRASVFVRHSRHASDSVGDTHAGRGPAFSLETDRFGRL